MNILSEYGWNSFHESYFIKTSQEQLAGRVVAIKGFKYEVMGLEGAIETELSGKLLFAAPQEELPKVGDWVIYLDYGSMGYIIDVFPRLNELSRKNPGTRVERQILATNVDMALVVQSLDQNFNLMRLERYLVQLAACNINACVVLNKSDLVADATAFKSEVTKLGRSVDVVLCSTYSGDGLEQLYETLIPRLTYIMIGSSGVGKSSLLNSLLNKETQKVNSTSDSNQKGKHTTTSRELFQLSNGSLMIDTPGMREFGVTGTDGDVSTAIFPMIDKFAANCRFSDCRHTNELGCAVLQAANSGTLDAHVYESYIKLLKEQRRFEITAEEKKRFGKQSGKMSREASNYRKKHKF